MKYIPKWLAERLPQAKETVEDDEPRNSNPDDLDLPKVIQDFLSDAPMPEDTLPNLEILEADLSDVDESPGIDPYNTGVFQKK